MPTWTAAALAALFLGAVVPSLYERYRGRRPQAGDEADGPRASLASLTTQPVFRPGGYDWDEFDRLRSEWAWPRQGDTGSARSPSRPDGQEDDLT